MKGKRVYAQLAVKRESPVMFRGCQFETIGEKQLDKTASMFGNSYSSWEMEKLIYTLYSIQISFSLRRKNRIMSEREFEQSSLKIKEIICRGFLVNHPQPLPRIEHFQGRMFRNFYRSWEMEKNNLLFIA